MKKKTLYVHRPVLNTEEIANWYKEHDVPTTLDDDMHVTLAFSRELVDWDQFIPRKGKFLVYAPFSVMLKRERSMSLFGDDNNVLVLEFSSPVFQRRWKQFMDKGASWDHDGFKPHITITYNAPKELPAPYPGNMMFGPEIFGIVDEDWAEKKKES